YTGEWWEDDVQLLHLRTRWYDPDIAYFMSRDLWPGNYLRPETFNGYDYANNNPINYIDPTGFYAEGEIEEYVNMPLFSYPTVSNVLEDGIIRGVLDHLGHEPWLRQAVKHPLLTELYREMAGELRNRTFYLKEQLPEFYSTVRDRARRLILKDGLCGVVDVELEATHLAIITIASVPAQEHNLPVRPKNLWRLYPTFLPDGRWEEPGWDKTGHFFNHAFLTFESLYMRERQMPYAQSFDNAHLMLTNVDKMINLTPVPPGLEAIFGNHPIETLNTYYEVFSGPLYVSDITFLGAAVDSEFSLEDWHVYRLSRDFGLFYEWLSTVYPLRPGQDIDYWIIQQGHPINRDIITQGLFDPGLLNDLAANKLGAKFGIRAYHHPTTIPPRSNP
ncbi:hypothetical protein D6779_07310, partial [Candidatus Parcubacteria bacterium]